MSWTTKGTRLPSTTASSRNTHITCFLVIVNVSLFGKLLLYNLVLAKLGNSCSYNFSKLRLKVLLFPSVIPLVLQNTLQLLFGGRRSKCKPRETAFGSLLSLRLK